MGISKTTAVLEQLNYLAFGDLDGGGTGCQKSFCIRLLLSESITQIYVVLITYLGERRPFTASWLRGLDILMPVLTTLVDCFIIWAEPQ